jgi:hypothetical protein
VQVRLKSDWTRGLAAPPPFLGLIPATETPSPTDQALSDETAYAKLEKKNEPALKYSAFLHGILHENFLPRPLLFHTGFVPGPAHRHYHTPSQLTRLALTWASLHKQPPSPPAILLQTSVTASSADLQKSQLDAVHHRQPKLEPQPRGHIIEQRR